MALETIPAPWQARHKAELGDPLKLSVCNDETLPVGTSLPLKQGTVLPEESVVWGTTVSPEAHASGPEGMEIIRSQLPPMGRPFATQ